MPNPRGPCEPGTIYHVYNHGNGDDLLFREKENYRFFLERFKIYINPIASVYTYCLMPNHFHFLIRVRPEDELVDFFKIKYPGKDLTGFENLSGLVSRQFSNFFNAYSKAFNKMYERRGRLFESSMKRIPVLEDDYFTNLIRYIHFNPVVHGFVDHPLKWKFSSIHAFHCERTSLLCKQEVLDWFGGIQPFQKFHESIQVDEFDKIKHLTLE